MGSVLNVIYSGKEKPVAFYARHLKGEELNYSATELEALAVTQSVEHFAHYLFGHRFTVLMDHRGLESLLTSKTLNRRLQRFAMKLQEWQLIIHY